MKAEGKSAPRDARLQEWADDTINRRRAFDNTVFDLLRSSEMFDRVQPTICMVLAHDSVLDRLLAESRRYSPQLGNALRLIEAENKETWGDSVTPNGVLAAWARIVKEEQEKGVASRALLVPVRRLTREKIANWFFDKLRYDYRLMVRRLEAGVGAETDYTDADLPDHNRLCAAAILATKRGFQALAASRRGFPAHDPENLLPYLQEMVPSRLGTLSHFVDDRLLPPFIAGTLAELSVWSYDKGEQVPRMSSLPSKPAGLCCMPR